MEKFFKKKLKNGMTVLFEKREVPVTTVMLAVKYGSAFESEKEKGMAHFIEHLCFKGTKKRSTKEIAFELEKVGGDLNAFTSEEETAYHVKLPSKNLNVAMDVIFDIFFNPLFPEEEIKKEANVICEEIKMYRDNPQMRVMDKIKSCLYEKPFGLSIAGSEENVRAMTREMLLKKHDEVYCTENSVLCVVGNNNFDEVLKLAEKYSVNRKGIKLKIPEIKLKNVNEIEKREDLEQANITLGIHFPTLKERERYAAEVFSSILGDGMSSKLFTEVREKRGLAYTVKTILDKGNNYSYMMIFIGTEKDKVDEVIKICAEEFSKMSLITEKELSDGKEKVIGNFQVESENCRSVAHNLVDEELSGDAKDYYKFSENVNKVSLEDIKKLAEIKNYSYYVLM